MAPLKVAGWRKLVEAKTTDSRLELIDGSGSEFLQRGWDDGDEGDGDEDDDE